MPDHQPHPFFGHLSNDLAIHIEGEIVWLRSLMELLSSDKYFAVRDAVLERAAELDNILYATGDKSIQI